MQIEVNAEKGNAPEPLKFSSWKKYFRVVNRSSFNRCKEIRMCFLQERFYFQAKLERASLKKMAISEFRVSSIN